MKLHIEHVTTFTYQQPISEAYTEMRLAPIDSGGQRRTRFSLKTEPAEQVTRYLDRHNNEVHYFDVLQSHNQLKVIAISEVHTADQFEDNVQELSPLDQFDFLTPSVFTESHIGLHELAEQTVVVGNKIATTYSLMNAVHGALKYERGATNVKTTAAEALVIGKGVCQDYAHVMLAACRLCGIPARYVSGYLFSPNAPEMASHAWVDVFVTGYGWRSMDPTHNCLQDGRYVRVAVGRDYADVPPTKGIYKGNAKEQMDVHVNVKELH